MSTTSATSFSGLKFRDIKQEIPQLFANKGQEQQSAEAKRQESIRDQWNIISENRFSTIVWAVLGCGAALLSRRRELFPDRVTQIPNILQVALVFFSIFAAVKAFNKYFAWSKAQQVMPDLEKNTLIAVDVDSEYETLSPEDVVKLWENPKTQPSVRKHLADLNFSQIYAVWKKLPDPDKKSFDDAYFKAKNFKFSLIVSTLEKAKDSQKTSIEQLESLLLSDVYIKLMKDTPGLFNAFKYALCDRSDGKDLRVLIFRVYYKMFRPDADLTMLEPKKDGKGNLLPVHKVTVKIRRKNGSDEQTLEKVEGGILSFLGSGMCFGQDPLNSKEIVVTLDEQSDWTPSEMKKVLEEFIEVKEPTLDWLLQNYVPLSVYNFDPYLYRMHSLLYHHCAELPGLTTLTVQEIAALIYQHQPKNIKKLADTWRNALVNQHNLLLAMTYAKVFNLKDLKARCQTFIAKLTDRRLFRFAYEHASILEDEELQKTCVDKIKQPNNLLHHAWDNLLDMSPEMIGIFGQRTVFDAQFDEWNISSTRGPRDDKPGAGLSHTQLDNTVKKLAEADQDDVLQLLTNPNFIELVKKFPKLFKPMRDQLIQRRDVDFRSAVHQLYMKVFYPLFPVSDDQKDRVTLTIKKKGQEVTIPGIPRGILTSLNASIADNPVLEISEGSSYQPDDLKKVIEIFIESKEPTFQDLLDHYEMLYQFGFEPFLYRFHQELARTGWNQPTRLQISKLLLKFPPTKSESIAKMWENKKPDPTMLPVAIIISNKLSLDKLKLSCHSVAQGYFYNPNVNDSSAKPAIFREIYEIAQELKDDVLLKACDLIAAECAVSYGYSMAEAWTDLFDLPKGLQQVILDPNGFLGKNPSPAVPAMTQSDLGQLLRAARGQNQDAAIKI